MVVTMEMAIAGDMMPCVRSLCVFSLYPEDRDSIFFQNCHEFLPDYMASRPED
jgi:hypothetical protein